MTTIFLLFSFEVYILMKCYSYTQIHTTCIYQRIHILCAKAVQFLFNPAPDINHVKVEKLYFYILDERLCAWSFCVLCSVDVPGMPDLFWVEMRGWIRGREDFGRGTGRHARRVSFGQIILYERNIEVIPGCACQQSTNGYSLF